jgi:hypothetical protein
MANVLEEYLVNIKYVVDSTSQNKVLEGLKHFAHSVLGINLEVLTLAGALTELTKKLAEAGEKWYWMGQQIGASVGDLISASDALRSLGMSSEAAVGSLNAFAFWTRSMGPAAMAVMRGLGVTATDFKGQLLQLGPILARMGGADPNNPNYWRALQWEQMMHISPELGLRVAQGKFADEEARRREVGATVWGVKPGQLNAQYKEYADQAERFMKVMHNFGFAFEDLYKYFGLELFKQLTPTFEHMFKVFEQNMPTIRSFIHLITSLIGEFFRLADAAITLTSALAHGFSQLPGIFEVAIAALTLLGARLLMTPIGRIIAGLSFLLLLMEDYIGWQHKMKSAFDWSSVDKAIKTKPEERSWWQTALHYLGQVLDYSLAIWLGWKVFGGTIRTVFRPIAALLGRLGLGTLLRAGGVAGAGLLTGGLVPATAIGAAALGGAEILIGAAIGALIYKAGEWLFSNTEVQNALKEGAEGFWDFIKGLFANQEEADPTGGSVNQPKGLWNRVTQGAGGMGPAGDPVKEADMMKTLTSKYGLSREDAAAWITNWEAESGLRSDITNQGGGYNPASTRAYGLMQWIGPRLQALKKFAADRHLDIRQMDTQLAFWWQETHENPTYKNIMAHVAAAKGRHKAEVVFHEAESGGDPSLEHDLPGHTKNWERIANLPDTPSTGPPRMGGGPVVQNNKTDINITHGPTAASTAAAVADKQDQVHRDQVRTLRHAAVR